MFRFEHRPFVGKFTMKKAFVATTTLLLLLMVGSLPAEKQDNRCRENQRPELQTLFESGEVQNAPNPFAIGATAPIDLTPEMRPQYNKAALEAEYEGVVVLELVIARTGDVLRACVVKGDPHGLAVNTAELYLTKKFKPSYLAGKPITIKQFIPVRFEY